ncbi:SRPBCC family protein [Baaleninema sp.]|uniref:SRPBCC family protein n=1 Tax=Baaleninema sp. TaxID=3101197 RepID=UPI003D05B0DC
MFVPDIPPPSLTTQLTALSYYTTLSVLAASGKAIDSRDALSDEERQLLDDGKPVILGENGNYQAWIVAEGSLVTAWEVLTDYNRFGEFLSNVKASQLLESEGNRRVFQQVNRIIFNQTATVSIGVVETYLRTIEFHLVEGDLGGLDGVWSIEPLPKENRVLISHRVSVDPGSEENRSLFFRLYRNGIEDSLRGYRREIEGR